MENQTIAPQCLECFSPIKGRTDKRFCDDACRTSFNNKKRQLEAKTAPDFLKKIPKILLNNYRILKKCNTSPPTKIERNKLEALGFNFNYITSCYTTKSGDIYQFCFDQGYLPIKEDVILLVVQPSQVIV